MSLAQFSGEIALTDSQVTNVVCNSSGMTCVNGQGFLASSFGNFHPTNTGNGIYEYGRVTFTGRQECDSLYLDCISRLGDDPIIPTSISNAYIYKPATYSGLAYNGQRLYNIVDAANLYIDGKSCAYPNSQGGECPELDLFGNRVTNLAGKDLYVSAGPGQQTYVGANNMTQAIFNGTGIYPYQTQDFGGSDARWNNGYFNTIYYNNVNTQGLSREHGKTCTIAGYVTLKINGVKRKLAYCK